MSAKDRLIFALDVNDKSEARRFVQVLYPYVGVFKVGLELFLKCGSDIVKSLSGYVPVFLDLKLHDIPNTVGNAAAVVNGFGASYLTVFADSDEAIRRATEVTPSLKILAVSHLTSSAFSERDRPRFMNNILLAKDAGASGAICPGSMLRPVRQVVGKNFILITPGIRLEGDAIHDQRVIITPRKAILDGADKIVVGRPIRTAPNPEDVAKKIVDQIEEALEEVSSNAE